MKRNWGICILLAASLFILGCARIQYVELDSEDQRIASLLSLDEKTLGHLKFKPLYQMTPQEVDQYLGYLYRREPDLQKRIVHLARKNIGQPYEIFLLGEFPFELYDPDPLYILEKSDCVVFSEHTYAMALSRDWREFFKTLMRLRYKDGEIGMLTRNHYTITDWDRNNAWFLRDITREVGGDETAPLYKVVRRANFFSKYGIGQDIPPETVHDWYVPSEVVLRNLDRLHEGDFVNVIRGNEQSQYAGHVGLITRGKAGEVYFLHSTPPQVREELLSDYLERTKGRTLGLKFLRPRYDDLLDFNIFEFEKRKADPALLSTENPPL